MTQSLYRRVLGPDFSSLPARVRELHDIGSGATWTGFADVERGSSLLARMVCVITALPPTAKAVPLTVTFTPQGDSECWQRQFGDHVFFSRQRPGNGAIVESIGPVTLHLQPKASSAGLSLTVLSVALLGIPLPRRLLPRIRTQECECAGRYAFEVEADLPLIGRLIRYAGWLERT